MGECMDEEKRVNPSNKIQGRQTPCGVKGVCLPCFLPCFYSNDTMIIDPVLLDAYGMSLGRFRIAF